VEQLAEYQEGYARVVVSRDEADLVIWSDFDDNGRSIVSETRVAVADYVARGDGPWPWFDVGTRRAGALQVLDALGVGAQPWTEPLPTPVLTMFERARNGWASVSDLLGDGIEVDVLDACGATPLWYAARALQPDAALALLAAGADASRRIELSARGERFTTILHELVELGRSTGVSRALANGVDPALLDSQGATPLHVLAERADHVNPDIARALVAAGADVNADTAFGGRPIEAAACKLLPATVATLLELGAEPANALDALLAWWSVNVRWAAYRAGEVVAVIDLLRAAGAPITERHRELAAAAEVAPVVDALGTG
jgi:hypothetical protein